MVGFIRGLLEFVRLAVGLIRYGIRFVEAMFLHRADSAARIIVLESQLDARKRQNSPKRGYRFLHSFRFLWIMLVSFWSYWETVCHAMKLRTVIGLWRHDFCRYGRSISQGKASRKGLLVELRRQIRWRSEDTRCLG
jgi:hypothetical protein